MLLREISGLDKMKEAYMLLDASVREGRMKPLYDNWLKAAEEQIKAETAEKEAAKKQEAGIEAPVFTLNDLEGKPLALTSLRGKYVILDFWGSWCVWCITALVARILSEGVNAPVRLWHHWLPHQDHHRPRREDREDHHW